MTERLISKREFASRLNVSENTLHRLEARDSTFPARRAAAPGRCGYLEADADRYILARPVADLSRRTEKAREVRAANIAAAKAAKAARDQEGKPEGGEAV